MDQLDHPERGLRGALVAGTNGKGSVVALARSVLQAAGLAVGTMPKPHLVSYRERVAVDGEPIDAAAFAAAVTRTLPAIDRVAAEVGPPTEFEALTAVAIGELARRRLDLVLIEVGMGGRLDATNVLDLGVAVVTNVQLDHERYLGPTLRAIGGEKAAIIKPVNLAVTGASGRGLQPVLDRCATLAVPLRRAGPRQPYRARLRHAGWDGIVVDATTPAGRLRDLRVGLLGGHQAQNAAVALALLDALREDGARSGSPILLDEAAIRRGLAAARWPGRLELIDGAGAGLGRILLDGAHNPAGARALAAALIELGLRRPVIVLGAMRGKRIGGLLRGLAPIDPRFVFTRVTDAGAHDPQDLADAWRRVSPEADRPAIASTPAEALPVAAGLRRSDDPIVVAGSLYLVGAVRGMLTGETEDVA